jgi:MFS family permease
MNRRTVACLSYAVQLLGAGLLILSGGTDIPLLIGGVLLFGFGIGNATSLPPLIAQQEFPKAEVQRVVSMIVAGAQTAYAFAPAVFAAAYALSSGLAGTWPVAFFALTALCQGLAIVCMLLGRCGRKHGTELAPITR